MINDIRNKGFDKISQELTEQINTKNNINTAITNMQKQLIFLKNEVKEKDTSKIHWANECMRIRNMHEVKIL